MKIISPIYWELKQKKLTLFLIIIFCALLVNGIGNNFVVEQQTASVYPMSELLNDLAECESNGNEKAWNKADPVTPSIGLLQFKWATWQHFTKRYGLTHLDIMDGEAQKQVATLMLAEKRYSHWKNCLSDNQLN